METRYCRLAKRTTLNGIHNVYGASHMHVPSLLRYMFGKCEHGVLICLAPTNAKKSSPYSSLRHRYLNVPTWAKLGPLGTGTIFISSTVFFFVVVFLCVCAELLEKSPGTKIIHSRALVYLGEPVMKSFKVLFRINMSNPVPNTHVHTGAFIEKSDIGIKKNFQN